MTEKPVTAALVVIGNEVLSGRTQDTNTQFLGSELKAIGIRLVEVRTIPDDEDMIVDAVNALRAHHDYVFTTGGIGPTHDDITSAAIAKAFGVSLHRDPKAVEMLRGHYEREAEMTEARLKMTDVPEGAELVENPVSRAPGFRMENVYVFAGVPKIMQAMFDGVRGQLKGGAPVLATTLSALVAEGLLAAALGTIQKQNPKTEIGSYPFIRSGKLGTAVVVRAQDKGAMETAARQVAAAYRAIGADPDISSGES